jgi:hypothetical protein
MDFANFTGVNIRGPQTSIDVYRTLPYAERFLILPPYLQAFKTILLFTKK